MADKQVDKKFCMSSFLMYRTIIDETKTFSDGIHPNFANMDFQRTGIQNSDELLESLRSKVRTATADGKAALALSGGIDSAILAKFMPKGSTAYTFRCVVPGVQVTDETQNAAEFASACGLKHKIIEIYWEDVEQFAPALMAHKGMPIHSIEVQIYKAALEARKDGYDKLIFGENADIIYGGMTGLLKKDWLIGEFINRYSYILPYQVLREPIMITAPFLEFENDGYCDAYRFTNKYFRSEALGTYNNACELAGVKFIGPFSQTCLDGEIDLNRIRAGDGKYLVREVFHRLYPETPIPPKIPMPRPTNEWLKDWTGPTRPEFYPHCTDGMTGDQKWLILALERFLNMLDT